MAQQWDWTPGTINRAYRVLGQEGLLIGQPGKGTIVAPSPLHADQIVQTWRWAALVNQAERFLLESLNTG